MVGACAKWPHCFKVSKSLLLEKKRITHRDWTMNLSPFLSVDLKSAIVSLDRFKVAVNQAESHPEKGRKREGRK